VFTPYEFSKPLAIPAASHAKGFRSRTQRKQAGFSQQKLAEKGDWFTVLIRRIETLAQYPSVDLYLFVNGLMLVNGERLISPPPESILALV
jgi:transcriptional regulator with XRE-family HTH domain